jgi:hypothetical protein
MYFNGCMAIIFYSSKMFEEFGIQKNYGNFIIMSVNMLANIPAFFMLKYLGRRQNLLVADCALDVILLVMAVSLLYRWTNTALLFIALFHIPIQVTGTIGLTYAQEVSNYKGVAVGGFTLWSA